MARITLTADEFTDLRDMAADDLRPYYSGRGMYGSTCLGYVVSPVASDDVHVFLHDLARIVVERDIDGPVYADDIRRVLEKIGIASDSMGRGLIYYFPGVEVEPGVDEDEEE